jgi:hypothetical protein
MTAADVIINHRALEDGHKIYPNPVMVQREGAFSMAIWPEPRARGPVRRLRLPDKCLTRMWREMGELGGVGISVCPNLGRLDSLASSLDTSVPMLTHNLQILEVSAVQVSLPSPWVKMVMIHQDMPK